MIGFYKGHTFEIIFTNYQLQNDKYPESKPLSWSDDCPGFL